MFAFTLALDGDSKTPLYEQIYAYIKNEIRNGKIECRSKLPSARALAEYLQISRSTVDMAYAQLVSEGYIESVPCKGYYVCEISLLYDIAPQKHNDILYAKEDKKENLIDFTPNGIDLEYFPFNTWRKIIKNVLNVDNKEMFGNGDSMGDMELRSSICSYLFEARNVHCSPEQILIGAGNYYLTTLLCRIFDDDKVIAMESPTYQRAYNIFRTNGRKVVTVKVDGDGINMEMLKSCKADVVYVMPSHHYPLGTVMPISKRVELLKWANESDGRYIIEDDYDSEFRYHGKPVPALKGISENNNIIYIGTFSKSIAPGLRMSYMVLPEKLLEIYRRKLKFCSQTVSRIEQATVREFIEGGYFERHLNRMRAVYREKHDMIIAAFKENSDVIRISGENAGLHLLLEVNNGMTEDELIAAARKNGVRVYGLSENFNSGAEIYRSGIILGFAIVNKEQIEEGIKRLKEAWLK